MVTLADYERWKAQQQKSQIGAASLALESVKEKPDAVAADLTLADQFSKVTGKPRPPLDLVKIYRPEFQKEIERQQNERVLSGAPLLAEWLRDADNASLAKDDLENLSWWEGGLNAAGNALKRGASRVAMAYNQILADRVNRAIDDRGKGFLQILSEERTQRDPTDPFASPLDLLGALDRYSSAIVNTIGGSTREQAAENLRRAGEWSRRISEMPMSESGGRFRDAMAALDSDAPVLDQVGNFFRTVANDPSGFLAFLSEVALESVPQIAAAGAVTAATRNPAAGAASMGFGSYAVERGSTAVEFFAEKGIDISTPEGALQAVTNPELMQEAANKGHIRGLIIGLLDGLSGGVAGKQLAASPMGDMALQTVVQAVLGASGEAGAQLATEGRVNMAEVIVEGLAEAVTAPLDAAAIGGRRLVELRREVKDAEGRKALFESLSGQAQASNLRRRLPEKFRQFVERATENGPIENLYIPAQQFVSYFQDRGIDPYSLADTLEGVTREDLETAVLNGTDVVIPTATYAAKIAGSEHDAFLMDNMRLSPEQKTAAELREVNAEIQEALQAEWENYMEEWREEQALRSFEAEIYDTMVSRQMMAGEAADVSRTNAAIWSAFYKAMAERAGLTVEEMLQRYRLPQIQGAIPQGMQMRNVDEFNRTLAEARRRRTVNRGSETPLLEFISDRGGINDPGGELRARDAEVVKRGRGKKTLKLRRETEQGPGLFGPSSDGIGYGLDDVAHAAVEAGFMADDPRVIEYKAAIERGDQVPDIRDALLDAIDAELSGRSAYVDNETRQAEQEDAEWDAFEEYLNRLGVSLSDPDDVIRAAVEADQKRGVGYDQADGAGRPGGKIYHRYTSGGPDTGVGYMMFAEDQDRVSTAYGPNHYIFDSSAVESDRVIDASSEEFKTALIEAFNDNEEILEEYNTDAETIASWADPDDIVNSADLWDNPDLVQFVWENVLERNGWDVVLTDNGAVVFDPDLVKPGDELHGKIRAAVEADQKRGAEYAQEALPETIDVDGVQRPTRNSEGRQIAQTEEGVRNFWRWFGSSRVVDEQGRPLVVYHGTGEDFTSFSTGNRGSFFTDDSAIAEGYGKPVAAYLSLKNPVVIDAKGAFWNELDTVKSAALDELRQHGKITITDHIKAAAEKAGYDGAIVLNVVDNDGAGNQYIAFRPEQIKSAIGNRGTFDPSSPRIYEQRAYHGTPHLFSRFSLDRIGTGEGAQAFGWGLYFTQKREIAEFYRKALVDEHVTVNGDRIDDIPGFKDLPWGVADLVRLALSDNQSIEAALRSMEAAKESDIEMSADEANKEASRLEWDAAIDFVRGLEGAEVKRVTGQVYEAEIPEDDVLLNWDKPLNEQPEAVRNTIAAIANIRNSQVDEMEALRRAGDPRFEKKIAKLRNFGRVSGSMTGEQFYRALSEWEGGDQAASEYLNAAGIKGIKYLDGMSRLGGEAGYNFVVFDDNAIQILNQYYQAGGSRGVIQLPIGGIQQGEAIIRLFENKDLSTFLHESGHFFLTVLQDMAAQNDPVPSEMYATVKKWWGENAADVAKDANKAREGVTVTVEDVLTALREGTTGDAAKDAAIDVGMQEQFARAFEVYLYEGKAPSTALREVFEAFRSWLIYVYERLLKAFGSDNLGRGLDVKVSDELRAVFDRMLATDEEIAKAQADIGGTTPVFATAEAMGLTPEEYEAFLKLRQQAEDEAKARLLRETMAPLRREREKQYKEEREKVREEVARQINAMPMYRAYEWLANGRWLGDGEPQDLPKLKLSKDILVDRYGVGILDTLRNGRKPVYSVEGGADPDDVAGWFGFDSGDALVKAIEKAPPRKKAIEDEVDRVMFERHGDPLRDGSVEAEALDAVHTDKRGQWIARELAAIVDVAGFGTGLTMQDARASARQTLSRMRVRDAMNSQLYLAAERKAAEEAARLGAQLARQKLWTDAAQRRLESKARAAARGKGSADAVADEIELRNARALRQNETVQKLIEAKRRQLMNHALYMESRKVADEVAAAERLVKRLGKASTREAIAGAGRRENAQVDYLAAIDDILDRYDFRRLSGRQEQRRAALAEYVQAMEAAGRGNELAIPDTVLLNASRKPYKTIPVEELRGVVASLKNIEHTAKRWNKLIDAEKERQFDESVGDILGSFETYVRENPPGRVGSNREKLRHGVRQFLDVVLNATTILREIDGFKDQGNAYQQIKAPIDAAMNRLILRKEKATADLDALYAVYSKDERRKMAVRQYIPALGFSLSKWELISIALNTGNEDNLQRLTDDRVGGSLTMDQVRAVLDMLDERDAKFIQSVWDYLETFRDDIAARERRLTGTEPQWVEPKPIEIGGVLLKGGYYPLKYDPRLSSKARDDDAAEISKALMAGRFGKAQTRNGHLKARAEASGRPVEFDMSVLHRHVNQVIYDLELSEPVANSWRLLQDGRVRDAFIRAGKQADFDALETWLLDVGTGEIRSADIIGRGARALKSNFTAAKLAFNLSTVAVQLTGLAQSIVVVGKRDFVRGVQASFRPGVPADIVTKSPFMRSRQTTFNKDIYDFYNDPKMGPVASRWGDIKREWIGPMSFWLMTKVQWYAVDIPTWLAGYEQGLRMFDNDEAKAIAHADDIVKRAQASGMFSDRSAIERGSVSRNTRQNDVIRLFTALGSYMFAKFNVAYERSVVAGRAIREQGMSTAAVVEALSWALDMAFLFTVEAVLYAAIKGRLPDEDDDEDEGWLKFLATETAFSVMSTIPGVRDLGSLLSGFDTGGAYGAILKEMAAPFQQIAQGELDAPLFKSIISAAGLLTGAPSTQINRAVDAAWRQAEGDDVSPAEYLLGRSGK